MTESLSYKIVKALFDMKYLSDDPIGEYEKYADFDLVQEIVEKVLKEHKSCGRVN